MSNRTLVLKRDVLQSLTTDELVGVRGAGTGTGTETMFSCLNFESCGIAECLLEPSSNVQ